MTPADRFMQAVVVLALVFGLGVGAAHLYYSPRLALAKSTADQVGDKLREQNRAVSALKDAGDKRKREADARVRTAMVEEQQYEDAARAILAKQRPPGADECRAVLGLLEELP